MPNYKQITNHNIEITNMLVLVISAYL